jgi:hypothetical protein
MGDIPSTSRFMGRSEVVRLLAELGKPARSSAGVEHLLPKIESSFEGVGTHDDTMVGEVDDAVDGRSLSHARTPAAWSCTGSPAPRRSMASGRDQLLDTPVRGHALRPDVVLARRPQVGMAQEVWNCRPSLSAAFRL